MDHDCKYLHKDVIKGFFKTIILLGLTSVIFFGCAKPKPPDVIWPLPPNKPRIKFIKSYIGPVDFKKKSIVSEALLGPGEVKTFMKPHGVHVDAKGRIYVTDTALGSVFILDPIEQTARALSVKGRKYFVKPIGVVTDKKGRIFVTDSKTNLVTMFDNNGNYVTTISDGVEWKQPTGIAVDNERNRLYITDTHRHVVEVYDLDTLKHVRTIGKRGKEEGSFNFPSHLAVGPDGKLYVTDTMNGRVQVFSPDLKLIMTIGEFGDAPGMFARPKGVAVDSENHVYVVDAAFNNVQIFNQEGQILMPFGGFGTGRGLMILPAGIAIDKDDFIYVVDSWNERLNVYEFLGKKHEQRLAAQEEK